MSDFRPTGEAFVAMAHRIVWCTVATVGPGNLPRTRILHPYWEWRDDALVGWVGTAPTRLKRAHLEHSPFVSVNYWHPNQDTCTAECRARWALDAETRQRVWRFFEAAPAPLGYDPAIIPEWTDGPLSDGFAVLRLEPYRLRVFPGSVLMGQGGDVHTWSSPREPSRNAS
jgi:hypothetical protein